MFCSLVVNAIVKNMGNALVKQLFPFRVLQKPSCKFSQLLYCMFDCHHVNSFHNIDPTSVSCKKKILILCYQPTFLWKQSPYHIKVSIKVNTLLLYPLRKENHRFHPLLLSACRSSRRTSATTSSSSKSTIFESLESRGAKLSTIKFNTCVNMHNDFDAN